MRTVYASLMHETPGQTPLSASAKQPTTRNQRGRHLRDTTTKQVRRVWRPLFPPLIMVALYFLAKNVQTKGPAGYALGIAIAVTALLILPGYVVLTRFLSVDRSRFWALI